MPFHKRWRELGEYSADGGDQAGFGVMGGHVGDVLDVWLNEVVQGVQVGGEGGGQWEKGTKSEHSWSKALVSLDLWASAESCCHTQGLPPATWLYQRIITLFTTSRYTFVLIFKPTSKMWGGMMWPSASPPPKDHPMCWAVPSSVEPSGFAFWGCWQWSCCHNLDR